jgi:hypothetical protein
VRPGIAAGLLAVATGVVVLIAAVGIHSRPASPVILKVACLEGSVWQDVSVKRESATYQLARNGVWLATVPLNACSLLREEQTERLGY